MTHRLVLTLVSLLAAGGSALAAEGTATTSSGESLSGEVVSLSTTGLALRLSDGLRELALDDLDSLHFSAAAPPQLSGRWIELTDGTRLPFERLVSQAAKSGPPSVADRLAVTLPGEKEISLPTAVVRWVVQRADENDREALEDLSSEQSGGDLIVVERDGRLQAVSGTLAAIAEDYLEFVVDGDTVRVKRERPVAWRYWSASPAVSDSRRARCYLMTGGQVAVAELRTSGQQLTLVTPTGVELLLDMAEIQHVEFSGPAGDFLSELTPQHREWIPFQPLATKDPVFASFYGPRVDGTALGPGLKLQGRHYSRGLGLRSRSLLVYQLSKPYTKLLALVGMDDRARPAGAARLVIRSQDQVLFDQLIAAGQPVTRIDVPLAGVTELVIECGFGDDSGAGDYLDLADARLVQ